MHLYIILVASPMSLPPFDHENEDPDEDRNEDESEEGSDDSIYVLNSPAIKVSSCKAWTFSQHGLSTTHLPWPRPKRLKEPKHAVKRLGWLPWPFIRTEMWFAKPCVDNLTITLHDDNPACPGVSQPMTSNCYFKHIMDKWVRAGKGLYDFVTKHMTSALKHLGHQEFFKQFGPLQSQAEFEHPDRAVQDEVFAKFLKQLFNGPLPLSLKDLHNKHYKVVARDVFAGSIPNDIITLGAVAIGSIVEENLFSEILYLGKEISAVSSNKSLLSPMPAMD
ncbi:uncharacterized protein LACBIDRAFT_331899 [Laccaria bicolor S238N-H82]|uniref:Predicted protein n=1 Tax=Laccaria bicolor (strain S238N-H82 / ATCC MYA-4686) TaxID=486041 RepID=B0DQZ1_LACBS|nr:uncharacterized protein LACBIDRAFT_331899 [Laccaria bicolor S238N-H82]EDR02972.1 predicted protein [Laccaria bicolor S238N-H82]|eukprot:XP_001886395.1 predicted protein [Laccaria bicolor S238N-H82]